MAALVPTTPSFPSVSPLREGHDAFLQNTYALISQRRLPEGISPLNREALLKYIEQDAPARLFADALGQMIIGNLCRDKNAQVKSHGPERLFEPVNPRLPSRKKRQESRVTVDKGKFLENVRGNPDIMSHTLEIVWDNARQGNPIFEKLYAWMDTVDGFYGNVHFSGSLNGDKRVVRVPTVTVFELAAFEFCEPQTRRRFCAVPEDPPAVLSDSLLEQGHHPVELGITQGKYWSEESSVSWVRCAAEGIVSWSKSPSCS